MNIWMITIGSSDVQLSTEKNWNHRYRQIRNTQCNYCDFFLSHPKDLKENGFFQVPARVMGIVYGEYLINEHYDDLRFPLFNALSEKLEAIGTLPDKIIIIVQTNLRFLITKIKPSKNVDVPTGKILVL